MNALRIWFKQSNIHGLIGLIAVVFALQSSLEVFGWLWGLSLEETILNWFSLRNDFPGGFLQPWTLLTHGFLHHGLFHVVFNAAMLWYAGGLLATFWKTDRVVWLFLTGIVAGGLAFWSVSPVMSTVVVVGASGGIYALLVVAALTAPGMRIRLFFSVSINLQTLVMVLLAVSFIAILAGSNVGGNVAHLGGALWAYVVFHRPEWLPDSLPNLPRMKKRRSGIQQASRRHVKLQGSVDQRLDAILEKIHAHGMESLTEAEKAYLSSYGNKQ